MYLDKYLDNLIDKNGSDMFLRTGSPARYRVKGDVIPLDDHAISQDEMENICREIICDRSSGSYYQGQRIDQLGEEVKEKMYLELFEEREYEGAFFYREKYRFRVGIFFQRNTLALVIRKINLELASFEDLELPAEVLRKLATERRGLILLTGITGSGKSTTIATLIEYINQHYYKHILSVEEPIEFTFTDKESLINQREVGKDVESYAEALKQFAMHSPDVIYIGQIRDEETMRAALTAAETGALVLSTIHSVNAPQTVERILNFFQPHEHEQVLKKLGVLLKGTISQRLIPRCDRDSLIAAYEVMVLSPTISRLIRENNVWDIGRYLEEGDIYGMCSFEQTFMRLIKEGKITPETAVSFSDKPEELELRIRQEMDVLDKKVETAPVAEDDDFKISRF